MEREPGTTGETRDFTFEAPSSTVGNIFLTTGDGLGSQANTESAATSRHRLSTLRTEFTIPVRAVDVAC